MNHLTKNSSLPGYTRAGFIDIVFLCATTLNWLAFIPITVTVKVAEYIKSASIDFASSTPFKMADKAINQGDLQTLREILSANDIQEPGWCDDLHARFNYQLTYIDLTRLLRHAIIKLPCDDEAFDAFSLQHKNLDQNNMVPRLRLNDVAEHANRCKAIRDMLLKTGIKITDALSDDYIVNVINKNQTDSTLLIKLRRIAPYRQLHSIVDPNDRNLLHAVMRDTIRPKSVAFLLSQGVDATLYGRNNNTPLHLLLYFAPTPENADNLLRAVYLLYHYGNADLYAKNKEGLTARELACKTMGPDADVTRFLENPALYIKNNLLDQRLAIQLHHDHPITLNKNIARQRHNREIFGPRCIHKDLS